MDQSISAKTEDARPDELLAEMAQRLVDSPRPATAGALSSTDRPASRIAKLNYSHDAMIDLIIATPGISQNAIALAFGYTPAWVSTVMASDLFQAKLAERRAQIVDPSLIASVEERSRALFQRSAQVLMEKLDAPISAIDDKTVLRSLEIASKNLGVGGNAPAAPQVDPDRLKRLEARLLALRGGQGALVADQRIEEAEIIDVTPRKEVANG